MSMITPVHRKYREVFCSVPSFEEWVQALRAAMLFFRKDRKRIMDKIAALRPPGPNPPSPSPPKSVSLDLVKKICALLTPHLDMKDPVQVCLILPCLLMLLELSLSSTRKGLSGICGSDRGVTKVETEASLGASAERRSGSALA